jgi:predicted NBD/HSP70 family sugar kinase
MNILRRNKLGKNSEHTKRLNRQTAIELIRRAPSGGASRADLVRAMEMSPQSISNIIAELETAGLLASTGKSYGAKGQPPTNFKIAPACGYGIGLHLDDGYCCAVLIDFAFEQRALVTARLEIDSVAQLHEQVRGLIRRLIEEGGISRRKLWGVGLASPRLTNERGSDMWRIEGSFWAQVGAYGLDRRIAEELGAPVIAENDANTGALGELMFGRGKELRNFCYLFLGRGLGCGYVQDHAVYRGAWGNAGEVGRILVPVGGNYVHLETILSVDGLLGRLHHAGPLDLMNLDRVLASDPEPFKGWVREAVPRLRWLISTLENTADPESIIIGGYLPGEAIERLLAALDPLHHTIAARDSRTAPRVQAGLGERDVVALGAAAMPILATVDAEPTANWVINGDIRDIYPA